MACRLPHAHPGKCWEVKIRPPAATAVVKVGNKAKEARRSPELEGDTHRLQAQFAGRTGAGQYVRGEQMSVVGNHRLLGLHKGKNTQGWAQALRFSAPFPVY